MAAPAWDAAWVLPVETIELRDVVGKGQFGVVYRGRLGKHDVAVKRIANAVPADGAAPGWDPAVYFRREVELLQAVRHPNVLRFRGIGYIRDELYIVTEFVDGGTLRTLLASANPSWPRRITTAIEIARALDHLHAHSIVHRDVKTENVLMTRDMVVKLCDFGLAREVAALRDPNQYTFCGSEFFEAPEIMFCMDYDERVDVFSYGLVLCELLSRAAPSDTVFKRVVPGFGINADEIEQRAEPGCPGMLVRIATECSSDDRDARPSLADVIGDLTTLYESLTKSTFVPYEDDDDDDDAADGANAMDTVGIVADSNVTEAEGDAVVPAGSTATDADASAHSDADTSAVPSAVPGTSADAMAPAEPTSASPSPAVAQRPLSMSGAPRMSISLVRSASGQRLLARDDEPAAASPSSAQPSSPVSGGGVRPLISLGPQARSSRALVSRIVQSELSRSSSLREVTGTGSPLSTVSSPLSTASGKLAGPAADSADKPPASTDGNALSAPESEVVAATSLERLSEILYYEEPAAVQGLLDHARGDVDAAVAVYLASQGASDGAPVRSEQDSAAPAAPAAPETSFAPAPALAPPQPEPAPPQQEPASPQPEPAPARPEPAPFAAPSITVKPPSAQELLLASAGTARRDSDKDRKTGTLRWLRPHAKKEDPTTCSMLSIARLQLVAQSVSTSKFAPLDPVRQARWAQFLIKFMQAIPVVDRQTRVRGHLQTTRRCFSGDDCAYWIAAVEPTIGSRKEAAELASVLLRLGFFSAVDSGHASGADHGFREGLDVLYRYRHDELELARLASERAVRVQSGPAAIVADSPPSKAAAGRQGRAAPLVASPAPAVPRSVSVSTTGGLDGGAASSASSSAPRGASRLFGWRRSVAPKD